MATTTSIKIGTRVNYMGKVGTVVEKAPATHETPVIYVVRYDNRELGWGYFSGRDLKPYVVKPGLQITVEFTPEEFQCLRSYFSEKITMNILKCLVADMMKNAFMANEPAMFENLNTTKS